MAGEVKGRGYRSPLRAEQAARTRREILDAARGLIGTQGYAATTVAQIAAAAGVAVDTVYAAVGTKPVLFRLLLETAISGTDEPVPAEERDYVRRIRAATGARQKIQTYAAAMRAISGRMAPLHLVLRDAAASATRSPSGGRRTCGCSRRSSSTPATCGLNSTPARSPTSSGA
jgi:AcrR family transcriptional regulator